MFTKSIKDDWNEADGSFDSRSTKESDRESSCGSDGTTEKDNFRMRFRKLCKDC